MNKDHFEHLPNRKMLCARSPDGKVPHLGDVLDISGQDFVVVGSLCVFGNGGDYPYYTAVREDSLSEYLEWMGRHTVEGGLPYTRQFDALKRELGESPVLGILREAKFFHFATPNTRRIKGRHDFFLPEGQEDALQGTCALHKFYKVNNNEYVIDGHFLTQKNGKLTVIVTLFSFDEDVENKYKTVPLDRLLSQPERPEELIAEKKFPLYPCAYHT